MKRVCTGLIMAFVVLFFISSLAADIVSAEETPVVVRGEPVPVTARLLQNGTFGDPVVGQRLHFYDQTQDSLIGSAFTDINGYATVLWNISINHPLGLSLLNVTFEGNTSLSLSPSCQWLSPIVVSRTVIEVQVDENSVHPGDEITVTARITDDHNVSISGASMVVYSDSTLLSVAPTNASGYATFNIDCNSTWCIIGQNTLRVIFEQDVGRFLNGTQSLISVDVHQISTSIETHGSYESALHLNDSFWLQMSIQAEGENHSGALIAVFLDANPIDDFVSDINGIATLSLDIDAQYLLGLHRIRMVYSGTFRYASSYLEIEISVSSPAVVDVLFPEVIRVGDETEVKIRLYDLFLRPIPNVTATLFDEVTQEPHFIPFSQGQTTAISQINFDGPIGPRNLQFEASHPFLINTTKSILVTIWFQPSVVMLYQSILGYASPSQEVTFQIQLNASGTQVPDRLIEWHVGDHLVATSIPDYYGVAEESFTLSSSEGSYMLAIRYNGSILDFELPAMLEYEIIVSRTVPVAVNLVSYSVSTAFQEVAVKLSIIALNGTLLEDVKLHYEWLSLHSFAISKESGIVEFGLRIPSAPGAYNLYYETEEVTFTQSSTGYHVIVISSTEAMAGQGVGMPVLVLSLGVSVSLVSIPVLWRRRLIG